MEKTQDLQSQRKWAERIEVWRKSGQSVSEWCKRNNITRANFYHWRKHLLQSASKIQQELTTPTFYELPDGPPSDTGIEMECQNIIIRLKSNFDPKTLQNLLKILREL